MAWLPPLLNARLPIPRFMSVTKLAQGAVLPGGQGHVLLSSRLHFADVVSKPACMLSLPLVRVGSLQLGPQAAASWHWALHLWWSMFRL